MGVQKLRDSEAKIIGESNDKKAFLASLPKVLAKVERETEPLQKVLNKQGGGDDKQKTREERRKEVRRAKRQARCTQYI